MVEENEKESDICFFFTNSRENSRDYDGWKVFGGFPYIPSRRASDRDTSVFEVTTMNARNSNLNPTHLP